MKQWTSQNGPVAGRIRRSAREIALAIMLTLAALIFGFTAIRGPAPETASVDRMADPVDSRPN